MATFDLQNVLVSNAAIVLAQLAIEQVQLHCGS